MVRDRGDIEKKREKFSRSHFMEISKIYHQKSRDVLRNSSTESVSAVREPYENLTTS